jgi:3',5'-cyclic AMP phosphodiesterase CpdA
MHISDLHFGKDLDKKREDQKIKEKIQNYFKNQFKHITNFLLSLLPEDRTLCDRLAISIQNFRDKGKKIDYLIVSGDITSIGDVESFTNAKHFLTNHFEEKISGLGFEEEKILIVPGNHDTILNKYYPANSKHRLENYYSIFNLKLPYSKPPLDINGKKFTFFCFDSTSPNFWFFTDGEIGQENIKWFCHETIKLRREYREDYSKSVKIVIFHHHPIPLPGANSSTWTQLIDGSKFLPILHHEGIDLVIHGHEHFNATSKIEYIFSNVRKKPLTICATGSATQEGSSKNTFNMYYFYEKETFVEIWEYEEGLGLFRPKAEKILLF